MRRSMSHGAPVAPSPLDGARPAAVSAGAMVRRYQPFTRDIGCPRRAVRNHRRRSRPSRSWWRSARDGRIRSTWVRRSNCLVPLMARPGWTRIDASASSASGGSAATSSPNAMPSPSASPSRASLPRRAPLLALHVAAGEQPAVEEIDAFDAAIADRLLEREEISATHLTRPVTCQVPAPSKRG